MFSRQLAVVGLAIATWTATVAIFVVWEMGAVVSDHAAIRGMHSSERLAAAAAPASTSASTSAAAAAAGPPGGGGGDTQGAAPTTVAAAPAATSAPAGLVAGGTHTGLLVSADEDRTQWSWNSPPKRKPVRRRPDTTKWDLGDPQSILLRRQCVQDHIFDEFGLDVPKAYFVQGCDFGGLYDFDAWAKRTGCGTEPIDGTLQFHTAWTGPYEHVREDLDALMQSYLTTQSLTTSTFTFWLLDRDPDPADAFQKMFGGAGNGAVQFKRARMEDMARGTAMEGKDQFLNLDWSTVKKGPRWRANIFRILILHRFGGIWVDTDTLMLRDMRPLIEFAGEFASKLTMSHYYNNNVMGMRAGSNIGAKMIEDMVATPFQQGERHYCRYVGNPCYPKWTWNHGLIQLAVRHNRGMVAFPTQFTDPAYACFPPWLLAKSGGMPMRDFNVYEIAEFIRGAFTLHTRAYNADKPIHPKSNYGRLYKLAREGAAREEPGAAPLVRLEPRDAAKKKALLQRRGDAVNVVDPGFVPPGAKEYVLLSIDKHCVDAPRGVKGQSFGGFPTLQLTGNCEKAQQKKFNETVVYIWQPEHGYLRPAHREPGRVLCIDAMPISIFPVAKDSFWNLAPQMISCKPDRPSQQWEHDPKTGNMKNPITGLCMEADQASHVHMHMRMWVWVWVRARACVRVCWPCDCGPTSFSVKCGPRFIRAPCTRLDCQTAQRPPLLSCTYHSSLIARLSSRLQRVDGKLILRPCEKKYQQRVKLIQFDRQKLTKDFDE